MVTSIDELQTKIASLQKANEILNMENEMLADYLLRHQEPRGGPDDTDDGFPDMPSSTKGGGKGRGAGRGPRRRQEIPLSLKIEERYRIANQEESALTKDIEMTKNTSEQNLDILRALMEETDIRTAEVKRDAYEFRRDIVVGAENPRTGKTMAEKVLKYMEDKLTQKDMLINKLLMRNQAYRVQIRRAMQQLKSKQETGDDLQYIDFHQLQIESQQYAVRIEEANQELIELKRRAGRTVKILITMKKRLKGLTSEAKFLQGSIKEKKAMLTKTEHELTKVTEERESARKEAKRLRPHTHHKSEAPQVHDYVRQKETQHTLEIQKKSWERKVEIAEAAVRRIRAQLRNSGELSVS